MEKLSTAVTGLMARADRGGSVRMLGRMVISRPERQKLLSLFENDSEEKKISFQNYQKFLEDIDLHLTLLDSVLSSDSSSSSSSLERSATRTAVRTGLAMMSSSTSTSSLRAEEDLISDQQECKKEFKGEEEGSYCSSDDIAIVTRLSPALKALYRNRDDMSVTEKSLEGLYGEKNSEGALAALGGKSARFLTLGHDELILPYFPQLAERSQEIVHQVEQQMETVTEAKKSLSLSAKRRKSFKSKSIKTEEEEGEEEEDFSKEESELETERVRDTLLRKELSKNVGMRQLSDKIEELQLAIVAEQHEFHVATQTKLQHRLTELHNHINMQKKKSDSQSQSDHHHDQSMNMGNQSMGESSRPSGDLTTTLKNPEFQSSSSQEVPPPLFFVQLKKKMKAAATSGNIQKKTQTKTDVDDAMEEDEEYDEEDLLNRVFEQVAAHYRARLSFDLRAFRKDWLLAKLTHDLHALGFLAPLFNKEEEEYLEEEGGGDGVINFNLAHSKLDDRSGYGVGLRKELFETLISSLSSFSTLDLALLFTSEGEKMFLKSCFRVKRREMKMVAEIKRLETEFMGVEGLDTNLNYESDDVLGWFTDSAWQSAREWANLVYAKSFQEARLLEHAFHLNSRPTLTRMKEVILNRLRKQVFLTDGARLLVDDLNIDVAAMREWLRRAQLLQVPEQKNHHLLLSDIFFPLLRNFLIPILEEVALLNNSFQGRSELLALIRECVTEICNFYDKEDHPSPSRSEALETSLSLQLRVAKHLLFVLVNVSSNVLFRLARENIWIVILKKQDNPSPEVDKSSGIISDLLLLQSSRGFSSPELTAFAAPLLAEWEIRRHQKCGESCMHTLTHVALSEASSSEFFFDLKTDSDDEDERARSAARRALILAAVEILRGWLTKGLKARPIKEDMVSEASESLLTLQEIRLIFLFDLPKCHRALRWLTLVHTSHIFSPQQQRSVPEEESSLLYNFIIVITNITNIFCMILSFK